MSSVETQPKPQETSLDDIVSKGIDVALQTIQERHEDSEHGLDFHNRKHTLQVAERTQKIAQALGFNEKKTAKAQLAAAFHDAEQKGYAISNKYHQMLVNEDGQILLSTDQGETSISGEEGDRLKSDDLNPNYGMFKRFGGANESASFKELKEYLTQEEYQGIFSEDDMNDLDKVFTGTIPGFDPEKKAITQPNIDSESQDLAIAIAMADLGAAGMEGAESLIYDGDANFREEHMKISREIRQAAAEGNLSDLSEDDKAAIKAKMVGWTKFQKKIAADQRGFFQERMKWLRERRMNDESGHYSREAVQQINALDKLFPTFQTEESFQAEIAKIDTKIAEREAMGFEELVKEMYPDIKESSENSNFADAEAQQAYIDQEAIDALRDKIQNL